VRVNRDSDRLSAHHQGENPSNLAANRDATHPRVVATSRGTLALWFEGQPWNGAKLMTNGRPIESATP